MLIVFMLIILNTFSDTAASPSTVFWKAALWQQILDIALDTAEYISHSISRRFKVMPDRHFDAWWKTSRH